VRRSTCRRGRQEHLQHAALSERCLASSPLRVRNPHNDLRINREAANAGADLRYFASGCRLPDRHHADDRGPALTILPPLWGTPRGDSRRLANPSRRDSGPDVPATGAPDKVRCQAKPNRGAPDDTSSARSRANPADSYPSGGMKHRARQVCLARVRVTRKRATRA
jgi:hypothetical protein